MIPQDRDPSQPLTVTYQGVDYTVDPPERWSIDVVEAFEEGKAVGMVKALLGPAQWRTFKRGATARDLDGFGQALAAAAGMDLPE